MRQRLQPNLLFYPCKLDSILLLIKTAPSVFPKSLRGVFLLNNTFLTRFNDRAISKKPKRTHLRLVGNICITLLQ